MKQMPKDVMKEAINGCTITLSNKWIQVNQKTD